MRRLKLILGGGIDAAVGIFGFVDCCDNDDADVKLTIPSPSSGAKGLLVAVETSDWGVVYELVMFNTRMLLFPLPKALLMPLLLPPIGGFLK
jgi:hypothetical protein